MNWNDTPQQAIEDYLEALLHDDLFVDEDEPLEEPVQANKLAFQQEQFQQEQGFQEEQPQEEQPQEESLQARQLRASMLQFQQAPKPLVQEFNKPLQHDEPLFVPQVILPNLKLPSAEPAVETLADVIQEIETARVAEQLVEEQKQEAELAIETEQLVEVETELAIETEPELAVEVESEFVIEDQFSVETEQVEVEQVVETETEPVVEVEPEALVEAVAQKEIAEAPLAGQPPSPPGWKNGRPIWAQERFECLLFKVKGLTLAVPLVELGGIIKIEKQPTPLFGQPDWFIGMLRNNNMNVSMVDTAQWVLPAALINKNKDPYKLVIRIHDSTWGLACNEVDRSISLKPEQVRWRTSLGKRPWLAGTVIEHMCALIDATAFDRLLKEGHGDLEPVNLKALTNFDD